MVPSHRVRPRTRARRTQIVPQFHRAMVTWHGARDSDMRPRPGVESESDAPPLAGRATGGPARARESPTRTGPGKP